MLRRTASKDRILAAALSLLETMDYDEITAERIISVAEVAKQTFYNHFADKQQVIITLAYTELLRVTHGHVDAACKKATNITQRIEIFLREAERYIRSHSDIERTLVTHGVLRSGGTDAMRTYIADVTTEYMRLIQPEIDSGEWPKGLPPMFFTELLTSAINSLATNYSQFPDYPVTAHRKLYAEVLIGAIAAAKSKEK